MKNELRQIAKKNRFNIFSVGNIHYIFNSLIIYKIDIKGKNFSFTKIFVFGILTEMIFPKKYNQLDIFENDLNNLLLTNGLSNEILNMNFKLC